MAGSWELIALSEPVVNIVGVGSTLTGDDGVGPAAIEALLRRGVPDGVCLYDAGLAVSDVIGGLDPAAPLVVIDALRTGGEAGCIYKADIEELSLCEGSLSGCLSLHEISVLPALRMEAMTGRAFGDVTVFGVEPQTIQWGATLSPPVTVAMGRLIDAVLEHAEAKLTSAPAGEPAI
ncbi:MAG: hydrogenase maturation protease [Phycisphaerae bacterium]|nr:hydrogenase maturation protease [Phycisphaerae bacterium]